MKRILTCLLALSMLFGLVACSSGSNNASNSADSSNSATSSNSADSSNSATSSNSSASSGDSGPQVIKFGLCLNALDENTTFQLECFMNAVEKYNNSQSEYYVETYQTVAQSNSDTQLSDVQSLILQDCDIIRVDAVDTTAGIAVCQAAHDAGIPVIETRGVTEDEGWLYQIKGMNEVDRGMLNYNYVEQYLTDNPDAVLKVGYLYGDPAQSVCLDRISGWKAFEEKYPDRVEIIAEDYGNWFTDKAMQIVENWLTAYPEMNAIGSASDDMALGAINVLKSAGEKPEDWLITSIDGTASGRAAVREGWLDYTGMMNHVYNMETLFDTMIAIVNNPDSVDTISSYGDKSMFDVTIDTVDEADALAAG